MPVDSIKTLIMVLEPEKPIIIVKAVKVIERDEHGLVHGEKIFHNLTISAFTKTEANEREDENVTAVCFSILINRFYVILCVYFKTVDKC